MKYFIASISKEHADIGIKNGFIQVCHGKQAPLKRMKANDKILIYSAKLKMESKEKFQKFVGLGEIIDNEIFQFQMNEDFCPFRKKVNFFKSKEVSILPLIEKLDFIPNKKSWGYPFRFGFLEIPEKDFLLIKGEMIE